MPPTLVIPEKALRQMFALALVCPVEVGGYGLVEKQDDSTYVVTEIYILDQRATMVSTRTSAGAIAEDSLRLSRRGDYEKRYLHWHSHGVLDAYFSAVDMAEVRRQEVPLLFSLVLNCFGEFVLRCDTRVNGVRRQRVFKVKVLYASENLGPISCDRELLDWAAAEVQAHVLIKRTLNGKIRNLTYTLWRRIWRKVWKKQAQ